MPVGPLKTGSPKASILETAKLPRDTKISEVMTTDVKTLGPDESIPDAVKKMINARVGAMPVVDGDGNLVGLLADEDIIVEDARLPEPTYVGFLGAYIEVPGTMKKFEAEFKKAAAAKVGDAMDTNPHTVHRESTVEDVATVMVDHAKNTVPVVDDAGKLVGVVARIDVVKAISRAGY